MFKNLAIRFYIFLFCTTMLSDAFAAQSILVMDSIHHETFKRPVPKNKHSKRSLRLTAIGYLTLMIPVLGVVSPFFIIAGIVSAIVGLSQISKTHESGKELAIISLVFGGIYIVVFVAALITLLSLFA